MRIVALFLASCALGVLYYLEWHIVPFAYAQAADGTYIHGEAFALVYILRFPAIAMCVLWLTAAFCLLLYSSRRKRSTRRCSHAQ